MLEIGYFSIIVLWNKHEKFLLFDILAIRLRILINCKSGSFVCKQQFLYKLEV